MPRIRLSYLYLLGGMLCLLMTGCRLSGGDSFDVATTRVSMIIYFVPDVTHEEVIEFEEEVLRVPRNDNSFDLAPGVYAISACQSPPGYSNALCLEIDTMEHRIPIREAAESWPTVQAVLEDVIPLQVTRADIGLE